MTPPHPFFLRGPGGGRFCILHEPPAGTAPRGAVLHVPAFAEEMNKSRRMVARQSRELAAAGFAVLVFDLYGTGDSAGEFGAADWDLWLDDVALARGWLAERARCAPILWGLRAGCLLALDALRRAPGAPSLLLWQPVLSGKTYLNQFLRTRVAAGIGADGAGKSGGTKALRDALAAGTPIEVGGYELSPALARGLEASELAPALPAAEAHWFEVGSSETPSLAPAAIARMEAFERAGWTVHREAVSGVPFWQSQEIGEAERLLAATGAALTSPRVAA